MKKIFIIFVLLLNFILCAYCENYNDVKQQALALYATKNLSEAYSLLQSLPIGEKDEEVFLILSNISQSLGDDNLSVEYLNKSLSKNPEFYKAYYNLGCIFLKKKAYPEAIENFKLALKYNKNASIYYNLAYSQIELENYKDAKKNLIKALQLEPLNKDCLYNLIYCYKKLNKEKQAKKVLDSLNRLG